MNDFNYQENGTILTRPIDLVLEQLDMLLSTRKCTVLGDPDYGQDFEKFLYETNLTNSSIRQYIYDTITKNVDLMGIMLEVNVDLLEGTQRDIILVNIYLKTDDMMYNKTFKIE